MGFPGGTSDKESPNIICPQIPSSLGCWAALLSCLRLTISFLVPLKMDRCLPHWTSGDVQDSPGQAVGSWTLPPPSIQLSSFPSDLPGLTSFLKPRHSGVPCVWASACIRPAHRPTPFPSLAGARHPPPLCDGPWVPVYWLAPCLGARPLWGAHLCSAPSQPDTVLWSC